MEQIHHNLSFLNMVITVDESWVFQYDPEANWPSLQWKYQHVTLTKEGQDVKIQGEDHADCIL